MQWLKFDLETVIKISIIDILLRNQYLRAAFDSFIDRLFNGKFVLSENWNGIFPSPRLLGTATLIDFADFSHCHVY